MTDRSIARQPGEIIYHFDVERGSIPLEQFVDTARATREIIDDFNFSLFDSKLKYELRVRSPENGSLLEVLAVVVTVGGSILAFLGTDIGKALFRGLTKEEPAIWAEGVGARLRATMMKPNLRGEVEPPNALTELDSRALQSITGSDLDRLIEAEALCRILADFMAAKLEALKSIGITPEKFRAAYNGRNRVFRGCIDNPEVKGITFYREPVFNIKRSDFPRRITQLPDPPENENVRPADLNFEIVDIVVNSPNWKRDGRNWQAATTKFQDISFSIEDESFWLRVERRDPDLRPTIRDNMRVQWAYPTGVTRPTNVKVYRVLSYNGKQLSPSMSDTEIQALQASVNFVESEMPDLFDERRGSKEKNDKGAPNG